MHNVTIQISRDSIKTAGTFATRDEAEVAAANIVRDALLHGIYVDSVFPLIAEGRVQGFNVTYQSDATTMKIRIHAGNSAATRFLG